MEKLTEYQEQILKKVLSSFFGETTTTFIQIDPKLDEFTEGKVDKLQFGIFCLERPNDTFFVIRIPGMDINMKALIPDLANEISFCGGTTGSVGWGFTIPPQKVSNLAAELG